MLVYVLLIILIFLSPTIKYTRNSLEWYYFIVILSMVFYCFGYMTGSDWRSYEIMYEDANWVGLSNPARYIEPGYYLIMLLAKTLHLDFWTFFIFIKCFIFLFFTNLIKKCSGSYFYYSYATFLGVSGLYLFIDNPMRNLIAISIFYLALKNAVNRHFWRFIGWVLFASTIHFSALALIPVYWLFAYRVKNVYLFASFVTINVIFLIKKEFVDSIILNVVSQIPILGLKVAEYFLTESPYSLGKILSPKMLIYSFLFVMLLRTRRYIENGYNGKLLFNASVFFLLFYRISLSYSILFRFNMYFEVFFILGICLLIGKIVMSARKYYIFFLMLFTLYSMCSMITTTTVYVPYTNYLEYMFSPKPSFGYRSAYNERNSPYHKQ